jgi:[ribosomal protein S5]-alanine N-acetyltransferase
MRQFAGSPTIIMPPEQFRSPRVVLRRPVEADAEPMFDQYTRDPEVSRYLSWRPHRHLSDTRQYISICRERWRGNHARTYAIDVPGHKAAGAFELRYGESVHGVTFGYVLAKPLWGRGYMSEALRSVVEWAMGQPEIWRIWGFCDVENPGSARVMEKAGLEFEGVLRRFAIHPNIDPVRPRDCRCYARAR